MSQAFVTAVVPLSKSVFTAPRTSTCRTTQHVVAFSSRRVVRMISDPPPAEDPPAQAEQLEPPAQVGGDVVAQDPVASDVSEAPVEDAPAALDDAVANVVAVEGTVAEGDGVLLPPLGIDAVDSDLDDVEVLEECEPPQFVQNARAIAEARLKFKKHETDTGSPEYQIATLTTRITYLTAHLKSNPKDHASTRGLLKMVSTRRRLLKYLKNNDKERFDNIISGLGIRVSQQLRDM